MVIFINTALEINTSAAKAWELFGEGFGEVSTSAVSITSSTLDREIGVGAIRTIDDAVLGPGATQAVTVFDREAVALTYDVGNGLPAPIAACTNA